MSGMGGLQDKRSWGRFARGQVLSDQQCADLFHHEWLARLVCEILVQTATSKIFELSVDDQSLETRVYDRVDELGAWDKLAQAAVWGRTFGAGALLLVVEDGQTWDAPIAWDRVARVSAVVPLDKRALQIAQWVEDPTRADFAEPELYRLQRTGGRRSAPVQLVHRDRLIVFGGVLTGDDERAANSGWDYSCLQAVQTVLSDMGLSWGGAATLLQEASQGVYKVKNLMNALASEDGEEALKTRFRAIEAGRSVARALVMDLEEVFERVPVTFTGIPDVLDRMAAQLAAATRIPVTILMGQAPAGLGATGESDLRTWEGECAKWLTHTLKPRLEHLVRLLLVEGSRPEPESWHTTFPPVSVITDEQRANLHKTVAETDKIYIDAGVVLPEEVALSRFSVEGWSMDTQISTDVREAVEKIKAEQTVVEPEPKPKPEPEPEPNRADHAAELLALVDQVVDRLRQ